MEAVSGQNVANFLGQGDDSGLVELADRHVVIVAALASSYTRGVGFDDEGEPAEDLAAVITTATARLTRKPDQVPNEEVGPFKVGGASFTGWSLPELVVLNRYRRRAR